MAEPLKLAVMTSGSPLLAPILQRAVVHPKLRVRGICFDLESDRVRPRRPLPERLRHVLKYRGVGGLLRGVLKRLPGPRTRKPPRSEAAEAGADLRAFAEEHAIPFFETPNIHAPDALEFLRHCDADLGLVVGARLLKPSVFTIPRRGAVNVHMGIIPDYRGGATLFWPLYNNEDEIGVSVHQVVRAVDSGDLYVQKRIPLEYDYAAFGTSYPAFRNSVGPRLERLAVDAMCETLDGLAEGSLEPTPIDTSQGKRYRRPTHRQRKQLARLLEKRYGGGSSVRSSG